MQQFLQKFANQEFAQQYLAALVIAMLAGLILQALIEGLQGGIERQKLPVMAAEYVALAALVIVMEQMHHIAMAMGTLTGGLIALLAMFAIHEAYIQADGAARRALPHSTATK